MDLIVFSSARELYSLRIMHPASLSCVCLVILGVFSLGCHVGLLSLAAAARNTNKNIAGDLAPAFAHNVVQGNQ
jgi:hypothetical protein